MLSGAPLEEEEGVGKEEEAKAAGEMAWIRDSRWCIRSSSVAARLHCRQSVRGGEGE